MAGAIERVARRQIPDHDPPPNPHQLEAERKSVRPDPLPVAERRSGRPGMGGCGERARRNRCEQNADPKRDPPADGKGTLPLASHLQEGVTFARLQSRPFARRAESVKRPRQGALPRLEVIGFPLELPLAAEDLGSTTLS